MSRPARPSDGGAWPWRHGAAGVIVHFRLTPKSSKEGVDGLVDTAEGPAFQARVRTLPQDGAANAALERLVCELLGVQRRSVSLTTGGKSRLKSLTIDGDPGELDRLLEAKLSGMAE